MGFGRAIKKFRASPGFRAYKNIGAANTKSGGTQFKNLGGGGWFSKAFMGIAKKRLSTMNKNRKGFAGPASKIVK